MGRFSKGLIPSPPHLKGLGHPKHISLLPVPSSGEAELGPVVDQGQLGSCTGNAAAVAIQARMPRPPIANAWAPLPSRLFLYGLARYSESSYSQDAGAMISDVFEGAAKLGVCPETVWTYPDVNADPDVQLAKCIANPDAWVYHQAADQKLITGAYRLQTFGSELVDDVKRAIAAGHPVVWGTELDMAFEGLGPTDVWPGVRGKIEGGHAMILHKFDGDTFWSRSSWGESFADAGSARVDAAAVMSLNASEFWIVELAPAYSEVTS